MRSSFYFFKGNGAVTLLSGFWETPFCGFCEGL
jgi:hypothetical protein